LSKFKRKMRFEKLKGINTIKVFNNQGESIGSIKKFKEYEYHPYSRSFSGVNEITFSELKEIYQFMKSLNFS